MKQEELNIILEKHKLYLNKEEGGEIANLSDTNLSKADLINANLIGADLRCADLSYANLSNADLSYANLSEANLSGADLRCADLSNTCVFGFCLGKHFGFFHKSISYESGDYVKIGCIGHSLDYWLANIESIGSVNNYNESEIRLYKSMLMGFKES